MLPMVVQLRTGVSSVMPFESGCIRFDKLNGNLLLIMDFASGVM